MLRLSRAAFQSGIRCRRLFQWNFTLSLKNMGFCSRTDMTLDGAAMVAISTARAKKASAFARFSVRF
jgi:hypothetical protein